MENNSFLAFSIVINIIFWTPFILVLLNRLVLNKTRYEINVFAATLILIMTIIFCGLTIAIVTTKEKLSGFSNYYLFFIIIPAYYQLFSILIVDKSNNSKISLAKFFNNYKRG